MQKFKVEEQGWIDKFSDDVVHCPFCGHEAPAKSWFTTEQVEYAQEQAFNHVKAQFGKALSQDVMEFNRYTPKGFITMKMKFSGTTYSLNIPASALKEMEQKIICENCDSRYAVVGSAFFCPCCGHNSAKQTFNNTIQNVQSKIENIEIIKKAVSSASPDEATMTCNSLIETSITDLIVAIQRLCECVYQKLPNPVSLKKNIFQRLDDGSKLWKDIKGQGYEDWLSPDEYFLLKKCFQQRHLLQHKDGIIDQDYIEKSNDKIHKEGQRLIVKDLDVLKYVEIMKKLVVIILDLSK